MSEEMQDRIHEELEYADSRSEWIRNAIELRFAVDDLYGEIENEEDYSTRVEMVMNVLEKEFESE